MWPRSEGAGQERSNRKEFFLPFLLRDALVLIRSFQWCGFLELCVSGADRRSSERVGELSWLIPE